MQLSRVQKESVRLLVGEATGETSPPIVATARNEIRKNIEPEVKSRELLRDLPLLLQHGKKLRYQFFIPQTAASLLAHGQSSLLVS
jgi:hypothetical protein